jgi:RNA polymerase sigma factor (sigma-70 family)
MLLNICRSRWRSKALEPEWAAEEEVNVVDDVMAQGIEADDIKEKVERFVARLPEKQRRIMTMRMQGATTDEIIEATGLSVDNVRTILSRTRQLIKEFYNRLNR